MPQRCENSDQIIHSEHDYDFSVGIFGAEHILMTSFWQRLQKNDTAEVASEKKGFILQFGADKTRSQWLKFRLVAQTCAFKTSFAFLN